MLRNVRASHVLSIASRQYLRALSTSGKSGQVGKAGKNNRLASTSAAASIKDGEERWWTDRGCPIVRVSDDNTSASQEASLRDAEAKMRSGWVWVRGEE